MPEIGQFNEGFAERTAVERNAEVLTATSHDGTTTTLSPASASRLRSTLSAALNAELAKEGDTLGLRPGDVAAISSSVGQSISF